MIVVYTLADAVNNVVRYVGVTNDLTRRMREHFKNAKLKRNRREKWIFSVLRKKRNVSVEIMATFDTYQEAQYAEIKFIAMYRALGAPIVNVTAGGEGTLGYTHTAKSKQKIGKASKGRSHRPETCEIIRQASLGRLHTEETKHQLAVLSGQRRHSPETREKIGAQKRGKPLSPEHRKKIRSSLLKTAALKKT